MKFMQQAKLYTFLGRQPHKRPISKFVRLWSDQKN